MPETTEDYNPKPSRGKRGKLAAASSGPKRAAHPLPVAKVDLGTKSLATQLRQDVNGQ